MRSNDSNAGCAIAILFFLFEFGFTGFDSFNRDSRRRTALWTLLQFPTHFCLLMYFAAIGVCRAVRPKAKVV
jgi:hypothetical protein